MYKCFCVQIFLLVIATSPSMQTVTLSSSDGQSCFTSGELRATFTCNAIGTELVWRINEFIIYFAHDAVVGKLSHRNGYLGSLLSKDVSTLPFNFTSVLYFEYEPTEEITVQCYNGTRSMAEVHRVVPTASPTRAVESIILSSSLKNCRELRGTFTCSARGVDLIWTVNGYSIYFGHDAPVGGLAHRNGYVANLLLRSAAHGNYSFTFTSVLYINNDNLASEVLTVECSSGAYSASRTYLRSSQLCEENLMNDHTMHEEVGTMITVPVAVDMGEEMMGEEEMTELSKAHTFKVGKILYGLVLVFYVTVLVISRS